MLWVQKAWGLSRQVSTGCITLSKLLEEVNEYIWKCLFNWNKGLLWWLRWYSICLQRGRPRFSPCVGKISWRRKWQPTPVFLPGESHGRRNLVTVYRLQSMGLQRVGHNWVTSLSLFFFLLKKLNNHKRLWFDPPGGESGTHLLQYSCRENAMDGGAWRAIIHGVTKSQTRLNVWALYREHCTIFKVYQ